MTDPRTDPRKVIGGREFVFGTLPADQALDVLGVAVKSLGAPLAKMVSDGEVAAGVIGLIAANIDLPEVKKAINALLSVTACVGQEGDGRCDMNRTFTGRVFDMLQVAVESFKVNFSDFLAAGPLLSRLGKKTL